jgi:hypothetical protein
MERKVLSKPRFRPARITPQQLLSGQWVQPVVGRPDCSVALVLEEVCVWWTVLGILRSVVSTLNVVIVAYSVHTLYLLDMYVSTDRTGPISGWDRFC